MKSSDHKYKYKLVEYYPELGGHTTTILETDSFHEIRRKALTTTPSAGCKLIIMERDEDGQWATLLTDPKLVTKSVTNEANDAKNHYHAWLMFWIIIILVASIINSIFIAGLIFRLNQLNQTVPPVQEQFDDFPNTETN